jgi:hypothetical protein
MSAAEKQYACPACGDTTNWSFDCPGYSQLLLGKEIITVCHPPCGNAALFTCDNCDWWYRTPNVRNATKMGVEPDWLSDALAEMRSEE